jgi:site-specific recombinase XerD
MTLLELKTQFLEYLEIERGRSQLTLRNYDFYLTRFLKLTQAGSPDDISMEVVRKYRLALNRLTSADGETLKRATQNYHLIALRSFLKFLAKRDIASLAPEKIELAKQSERIVSYLDNEDVERLLAMPRELEGESLLGRRDRAILELLFSTGLRVSELARLTKEDINLKKDEFTVQGKGGRARLVFISAQAKKALADYLGQRRDTNPSLFLRADRAADHRKESEPNAEPIPLTPRSIQRLVQHYAKAAGLTKKITPHTLRHSYATDLLLNGADIRSVQSLLGHSSITTTQIYTHVTDQQLKEVYQAFHGRRRKNS